LFASAIAACSIGRDARLNDVGRRGGVWESWNALGASRSAAPRGLRTLARGDAINVVSGPRLSRLRHRVTAAPVGTSPTRPRVESLLGTRMPAKSLMCASRGRRPTDRGEQVRLASRCRTRKRFRPLGPRDRRSSGRDAARGAVNGGAASVEEGRGRTRSAGSHQMDRALSRRGRAAFLGFHEPIDRQQRRRVSCWYGITKIRRQPSPRGARFVDRAV